MRRGRLSRAASATLIVSLTVSAAAFGSMGTAALFTSEYPVQGAIGAGRIFPGERDTPAFSVTDASSGTAVDASNAIAFSGDGLTATTSSWSTAFAPDRYLEFRMNGPLPTGLAMTSASFDLVWATSGSTACYWFEVRTQSGTLLESHGDAGSPFDCVSGATSSSTPLTSVATTNDANGIRVLIYAADSAAGPSVIDAATVQGDHGLAAFTLYPVELVDAADASADLFHWGPAGP